MTQMNRLWQRRWLKPNAHLYIRQDAWRFMAPGSPRHVGRNVVNYFRRDEANARLSRQDRRELDPPDHGRELRALLRLKDDILALRVEIKFQRFLRALKAYNPIQPRVPAGNPDGGQWTSEGGQPRVRLAAADKPSFGAHAFATIFVEVARRAIEAYRKDHMLSDLFGSRVGTVTYTEVNGEQVWGSNSTSPTYTSRDRAVANELRSTLIKKYPDVMNSDNIGAKPNDAVFHAETTALLRASKANGGTLAGQTLVVVGDRPLCDSCRTLLPYIGLEVGNPTVTFIDPTGLRQTIHSGVWVR